MMQLAGSLAVLVGTVLLIMGVIAALPIGSSAIAIVTHGAKRVRRLDEADNVQPGEVAKSGGRTLMAIGFAVGGLGLLFLTVILPLATGTAFQDLVWVRIFRFLINLVLGPMGFTI